MIKTVYKKIKLNGDWTKVNLGKANDFYLIAQRAKKDSKKNAVKKDEVKKIKFEVGIKSFSKNSILTINYITLNFSDLSSSDSSTNELTAMVKVLNYPNEFYIRPIEVCDVNNNIVKEGKTSILVGINALKLK